jgi:hypothetical protein
MGVVSVAAEAELADNAAESPVDAARSPTARAAVMSRRMCSPSGHVIDGPEAHPWPEPSYRFVLLREPGHT